MKEMSLEQFCWNAMCGSIGWIVAFLVFKFLENEAHEKITEVRAERNDRNNPARVKRPEEHDERPENRPQEHEEWLR